MTAMSRVEPGEIHTCPSCRTNLRIPGTVGGVTMACPDCGHKFYSPFRVGSVNTHAAPSADPARGIRPDIPPRRPGPLGAALNKYLRQTV